MFDTNVLVSASYWFGDPKRTIDLAVSGVIKSFSSLSILNEYRGVLARDIFESVEGIVKKVEFIESFSVILYPSCRVFACEDSDDNKVLETTFEAKADYIITNDRHLLKMKKFKGTFITTPKDFLDIINKPNL